MYSCVSLVQTSLRLFLQGSVTCVHGDVLWMFWTWFYNWIIIHHAGRSVTLYTNPPGNFPSCSFGVL